MAPGESALLLSSLLDCLETPNQDDVPALAPSDTGKIQTPQAISSRYAAAVMALVPTCPDFLSSDCLSLALLAAHHPTITRVLPTPSHAWSAIYRQLGQPDVSKINCIPSQLSPSFADE